MLSLALAILYALFLWWVSTGIILFLNRLAPSTYRWSLLGGTVLGGVSVAGAIWSSDRADILGAYLGFTSGVLIWGWLEMTYFMNAITGPSKAHCPRNVHGRRRFWLAIQTSLYHELAVVAVGLLLFALCWGHVNQTAAWTFAVLWWMRWSAKLNLFFGVPNLNEDWLPSHLRFLTSYLAKRPMNLLFPMSVTVATVVMALLVEHALDFPPGSFTAQAAVLAASLLALAILEHWFLVLPVADAALWDWAFEPSPTEAPADVSAEAPDGSSGKKRPDSSVSSR
ncbi:MULTISPECIES: putative photosynthetic complex assembly protein PuhE [Thiorhodovibrio]|uniref:putative photosynthetic complex assembly protein PuhE n=1 Tax=Thiorhodovibrio TaxID=61593 RepID=UPI001912FDC5|nr:MULTISPECIES: putative photosynthetic complex assembly protein PuhE [Thiorhodovibrio]MBK5968644.1 photosynthetic complex assembly protein 2 [Thiorhodovibrio winogradskyi]WPL10997.1 photosynthetic complex assembly protein [Thiorhodovibrio litoralis]